MRYIDLAVATLIGVSAFTGVVAWDPGGGDATSRKLAAQTRLRDSLLATLQEKGVAWFLRSPPGTICAYFASRSNRSSGVYATIGSRSCGNPPPSGANAASIAMDLVPFKVTLVAWSLV